MVPKLGQLCALGIALAFPAVAIAELPSALYFTGDSQCPGREAARLELSALLPTLPIEERASALPVELFDLGPRFQVAVAGRTRQFQDDQRLCEERARAAAAFVFLVLEPPMISPSAPLPPSSPSLSPSPSPSPRAALRRRSWAPLVELEVAAAFAGAPRLASDNGLFSGGAALRLSLHAKHVGAALGVEGLSPDTMNLGAARARLWRVPIDLSLRGALPFKRLELYGDLGIVLTLLRAEGVGLKTIQSGTRLDAGARTALGLRIWMTDRIALALGVEALISFQPVSLVVVPLGAVGETPRVWLGGTAGLVVRLH